MTRLALALALLASPVAAETINCGSDTVVIEEEGAGLAITYSNSVRQQSRGCRSIEVEAAGVTIGFGIVANAGEGMAERLTVVAPEGWAAVPPEIDVKDGDEGRVIVAPWLF